MRSWLSWNGMTAARRAAIGLMFAAVAMAGLSARAGERGHTRDVASAKTRDPFASYNKELNAAASHALKRVEPPEAAVRAKADESARLPSGMDLRTPWSGGKSRAARERVERLLPVIAPILRKAGVPVQLAAVVLVESGGDPTALSPKGARGLWQLMPRTAREYGLIVNGKIDQRLDVVLSTRAAAEYLRDMYAEFGSWKLALAAYNAGDSAVHRAMARTGGVGFVTARRALPAETQNYVPAVLHAVGWFGDAGLSPEASRTTVQEVAYATGE